jgi:thiol peroxidase
MEVTYNNKTYTLSKKKRKIGGEAPAVRITMLNNETKVIGMMAPKTQVMITLLQAQEYSQALHDILTQYSHKISPYVITSDTKEALESVISQFDLPQEQCSVDFKEFASKFGLNMEDEYIAKSLFVINKEGEISYIQQPKDVEEALDLEDFKTQLFALINQKQKGHTHENWMGV